MRAERLVGGRRQRRRLRRPDRRRADRLRRRRTRYEAYVIFGKSSGFANIDLTALAPADGFIIQGDAPVDYAGRSVSSAGDVNGDGFDDIIVGASAGDNGGYSAGEAYVVFGKSTGFADVDLGAMAPSDGFVIEGAAAGDNAGLSVSAAGDVNGDGFDDILVGAPFNDEGGNSAGAAYIIYGRGFTAREDADTVTEAGIATGSVFADNGSGADTASDRLELEVTEVNGAAASVGTQITLPSGALLTLNADGTYLYDPNDQFNYLISTAKAAATGAVNTTATDNFTYTLANGSTAKVTITITGVNSTDDELWGDGGNNVITGTPAVDVFRLDQGGNDQAIGQASGDDFIFGATFTAADSVNGSAGFDELFLEGNYLAAPVIFGAATLTDVERIKLAGGFSYSFTSSDATVAAASTLIVDASALGAANSVIFNGAAENNGLFELTGGAGADQLTGGALADLLIGGAGADQLTGNGGDDLFLVDNSGDQAIETSPFGGVDTVRTTVTFTIGANIEKLTLLGVAAINGTGNGLANVILGNSAANVLDGGVGNDQLRGGGGNDTYFVDSVGDKIFEISPADGTDKVQSSVSFDLGAYRREPHPHRHRCDQRHRQHPRQQPDRQQRQQHPQRRRRRRHDAGRRRRRHLCRRQCRRRGDRDGMPATAPTRCGASSPTRSAPISSG